MTMSHGSCSDLAEAFPGRQLFPLMIVGGNDEVVLVLNRQATRSSKRHRQLVVISEVTHLLEAQGIEGGGIARHIVVYPLLLPKKLACATL